MVGSGGGSSVQSGWQRSQRPRGSGRFKHSHMTTAMFNITSQDGASRCGSLATASGPITTPALLVYTHRGGALNLTTPDLLEKLRPELQAVQLDALQL